MARRAPEVPLPPGLRYVPELLTTEEEEELAPRLLALPWEEVRMHGLVARRRVVHFGLLYGYESWSLDPGPPIPSWLVPLRDRCARLLGVEPERLAELLVSHYPPGAGIGWHRDAPAFHEVVGVSLLGPARLRLQRGTGAERRVAVVELAPRSGYVISGEAREKWQHSIPPVRTERLSLSFRTLRRDLREPAPARQ